MWWHGRRWLTIVLILCPWYVRAQESPPPTPQGVEVQARGPVHEAYASPTTEPTPTKPVPKKPPEPIEEVPPEEKPEGDVVWIGGYWAWDDDRADYLWVSGVWRVVPPGRRWVAGYWRAQGNQWQWVPGFWTVDKKEAQSQDVPYLPTPPAVPEVAPPAKPPTSDSFYVPGSWIWTGERYVFRAGYWARVQPGYVWVADHYRWTPSGYVYVPGYWDLALKRRGILYAPVVISPAVRTVGFVYTPTFAVRDTVVVEALFVRPTACHYYFGDYYAPTYRTLGFESCVIYSRRRYEPIVVYECYERRDPRWLSIQINLFNDRCSGRAPRPPRTIVQQRNTVVNNTTIVNNHTTIVNNNTLIAPTKQVAITKNTNLVKIDDQSRRQARAQAAALQRVGQQRNATEVALKPGAPRAARTASLAVPKAEPVASGRGRTVVPPPGGRREGAASTIQPVSAQTPAANREAAVRRAAPTAMAPGATQANPATRPANPATRPANPATRSAVRPTPGAAASPVPPSQRMANVPQQARPGQPNPRLNPAAQGRGRTLPGQAPTAPNRPGMARPKANVPPGKAAPRPARRPPPKKEKEARRRGR